MNQPLVSIIIPTFNRAQLIGETLDSVLKQSYDNWECIVVDDGSTDRTKTVLQAYLEKDKRFKYYQRPSKYLRGGNGARNYGFSLSKGEIVQWFDSDDIMHEEKLEIQVGLLLESGKNYCVCQTLVFQESINNIIGLRKKHIYSEDRLSDFITSKITWLTQAPIFLKSFLLETGLVFDESLLKSQEYDFFIKVLYHDTDYVYTNKPLVFLRRHEKSISGDGYCVLKSYSVFKSSYNAYVLVEHLVNEFVLQDLKRRMVNQIHFSLINKEFDVSKKMINKFLKLSKSTLDTLYLKIGFLFCRYLNFGSFIVLRAGRLKK